MKRSFVISLVLAALVSCTRDDNFSFKKGEASGAAESWALNTRIESDETRNVLIFYSAGLNDLSIWLDDDINELPNGFVPQKGNRADHVFLVYSRLTERGADGKCIRFSKEPTQSVLFRLYKESGKVVHDTLKVWGKEVNACTPETMREVLQLAYDRFPAKGYGMVISTHASGWLPSGYYSDPSKFDSQFSGGSTLWSSVRRNSQEQFPPIPVDSYPAVKSVGQDNVATPVEMDLDAFVDAIPYHLDYLLFDTCLMGCVEVAYQLRGKADIVGFSQTEVLANGFNYRTLASRLLQNTPDPLAVCQDYFSYYEAQTGDYHSATISMVDTRQMDPLANVCKTLFEKYRDKINSLSGYSVQGYFRFGRHFFYDLKDILIKAGITEEEEADLDAALSQCVLYKAATDHFLSFKIYSACGFSMYLPSMGSSYLDNYYTTSIAWNKATELVK